MNISLQKDTSVSLQEQLTTQIAMQIASGILLPGAKLPSIRALSKRLGIHSNTCLAAYRELASVGMVQIRQGSGVTVTESDARSAVPVFPSNDLEKMAELFVQNNLEQGFQWPEILQALEKAKEKFCGNATRPLVFVDEHADILPVFKAEIEHYLSLPIQTVTLRDFNAAKYRNAHFIVSRYHHVKLKQLLSDNNLPAEGNITVIHVGSGQQELKLVDNLPPNSLVTVISACTSILQQGEAVLAALYGDKLLTRMILMPEEGVNETLHHLQYAKLVFTDFACFNQLHDKTNKTLNLVRVLPDEELQKLANFKRTAN